MTEKEIQRLADLLFDKISERQEQEDQLYHDQMIRLMRDGYTITDVTKRLVSEEEELIGELAKLQTILMILEDKEEYEKAAKVMARIRILKNKLK
jgi:alkyl sulfatase BDS1-like metallo-beta-lactamase superfamily hydrolase